MVKRTVVDDEPALPKGAAERQKTLDGDMGEFEDPWEDEFDPEDEDVEMDEGDSDGEGNGEEVDEDDEEGEEGDNVRAYLPGDKMEEDEELEVDQSAYDMLHSVNMEWPALSFDILPDALGENRTNFPMTAYIVAGTQADRAHNNKIIVMKMSQLHKTKHDGDESDADNSDSDDDGLDDDPVLESRFIKHHGGINRVRVAPHNPGIVAVWSELGKVSMYDVSQHVAALDTPPTGNLPTNQDPVFAFSGHPTEGFAMDWSRVVKGRFASGDCKKHIYLWEPTQDGKWNVDKVPFKGHTDSVEDIQWSPSEANVFASASSDHTMRIWDARKKNGSALTINAHDSHVNVIHWNPVVNYLMVSGGDDGLFKVWDLRTFSSGKPTPVASFKWHTGPITSVEWHPTEESVIAVSGADHQTTLWDLAVEEDTEAAKEAGMPDVPPQLLFIHQGQQDVKEHHWHRQLPSVLITTAATGLNVFKTISV